MSSRPGKVPRTRTRAVDYVLIGAIALFMAGIGAYTALNSSGNVSQKTLTHMGR